MKKETRNFYPGDEWLYFRIYTGIKTADNILISLKSILNKLKKENIISGFFFLRYSDPDFHIRLRIRLVHINNLGHAIIQCNKNLKKACNDNLIGRVEIGTYNRELERYSEEHIQLSEEIFSVDSEYILALLAYLHKKDDNLRWMSALMLIDQFFDDIKLDIEERYTYINQMSDSFKIEFGYNMYNSKQLNNIYRERKKQIETVLDTKKSEENKDLAKVKTILKKKTKAMKTLIKEKNYIPKNNISSYIHMSMNRLFRSNNRIHELLIYDFLSRHYKSELARRKYSK